MPIGAECKRWPLALGTFAVSSRIGELAGKIERMIADGSRYPKVERSLAERFMASRSPVTTRWGCWLSGGTIAAEGGYVVCKKPTVSPFAATFESEPLEAR